MKNILFYSLCCTSLSVLLVSCNDNEISCAAFVKIYINKETNIVVHDNNSQGRVFSIEGKDPLTGNSRKYHDMSGLYIPINANLELGDTLEKIKGLNCFEIKKKHFNVTVSLFCKDSIADVRIDTVMIK